MTGFFTQAYQQAIIAETLLGRDLRLGIIPQGSQVALTDAISFASLAAVEFQIAGWTRPTIQLPSVGAWDTSDRRWEVPGVTEFQFVAPGGGLDVRQLFLIRDGSNVTRTTTGLVVVVNPPMQAPVFYAQGSTVRITVPLYIQSVVLP